MTTQTAKRHTGPPQWAVRATAPFARLLAGRRWFPLWAIVHHRGRKSGTEYAVPVAVIPTEETIVIGLPWGATTDWARNVLAAGGCTVTWKGRDHVTTEPRLVGTEVALAAAGRFEGFVIKRVTFPAFLELQRTAP